MEHFERNEQALSEENTSQQDRMKEWGNNAPMLYLQPGTSMVRILPPFSAAGVFFREVIKHRVRVGTKTQTFVCPAAEAGLVCAVCLKGEELTNSLDEVKMEFARKNLRPRAQYIYNVIVHSAPANRKGEIPEFGKVYVMETGVMVHRQIIGLDQDPATGWADVTSLETGVNLTVTRTGSGLSTDYKVNPHGAGRTNLMADLAARGINLNELELINLDEVYALMPEEEMNKIVASLSVGAMPTAATMPTAQPVAAAPVAPAPALTPAPPAQPVPVTTTTVDATMTPGQPQSSSQPVPQPPAVPKPPSGF